MKIGLINGKIYSLDSKNSVFEALAIDNGRISHVTGTQDILNLELDFDQVIDLKGYTVLPGFIDGHTHLGHAALESFWVDLTKTETKFQLLEVIKNRVDKTPANEWVVGVGYDDTSWPDDEPLTIDDLNGLSTVHPIFVRRVCGHYGVVNTHALSLINNDWKYVDRKSGILLEDVVLGFMKIIKPDLSNRIDGMRKMLPNVYSLGLSAVREVVNFHSIKGYHELDKNNELKLRIYGYIIIDDLNEYLATYPNGLPRTKNFKIVGVKIWLDGSLGARTAALNEPYSDDPNNNGKLLYSSSELQEIFERISALDYPMMVHAIGDRAIQQFIDIYKKVFRHQIPDNPKKHSIEHVEVINAGLLSALKDSGVFVSVQPNFAGRWSNPDGLNERRLGIERLAKCNAYKEFIERDISIIFGSDSMPLDPLFGIKSAIFHPIEAQRIPPIDAVKAYTQTCYKLLNLDSKFGSIIPGKVADLVILTGDPLFEKDFKNIQVAGTIINGEVVYSVL